MTVENTGKTAEQRWERLETLFSQALDLPEKEREPFITRKTNGDTELRNELLDMLALDTGNATGPLTNAVGAALDATTRDRRKALVGRVVGNYRLVSVLGHGGTGTVYLGERADRQYSAQVAVKVVDTATLHGELGARFRAERQILASLNHPNIARLLDAGETSDSQPYLIMEYVHGEPLDRYCDRVQLDLRGRLQLFLDICTAVQYAHQNLIVHRDLKPANILVTAEGTPKLLDFGIAKLLATGENAAVLALTRMNDRLLTPEYASPEQILGRPVTTASDVYALGVVLYELLTGLRPYAVPASASQLELERSICVSDPLRPSTTVRRAMESGPLEGQSEISALAMARGALTADKLQRRLLGDLDAIIMRALRKEPQHRYTSVEQFAADVRRYLLREPVHARQGNWFYYSQRFARRHAFGASAGATFIVVTIAFVIAMSIQTRRTAAERDRAEQESQVAEQVSQVMLSVFSAADPYDNQGEEITARQLLERAGAIIREDLNQSPEVRARLLESIGSTYRRRGEAEESLSYMEDAVQIRKQMPDGDPALLVRGLSELAFTLGHTGDVDGAQEVVQQAAAVVREHDLERSTANAYLLTMRGRLAFESSRLAEARTYFEQSLALNRQVHGAGSKEVAEVLLALSRVFHWIDNLREAELAAAEAVTIYEATVPSMHPDRVLAEARLGEVLFLQGRINDAAPLFTESLRKQTQLFGKNSRQVADTLDSLARIRQAQGLLEEAERFAREALQSRAIAMGKDHPDTAYDQASLARILIQRAKYAEAEVELQGALDIYAKTLPPDHQYIASAEHLLGEVMLNLNRPQEAEPLFMAAMNRWKRTGAPAWRAARSQSGLGEAVYRQGRVAEAERYLTESYRTLAHNPSADRDVRVQARERVVRFYMDRGQRDKLEELMLETSRSDLKAPALSPLTGTLHGTRADTTQQGSAD